MLFLVISRHVPAIAPIRPQEELATIKAGLEMWAKHPKVKAFYGFAGEPAACALVETDTAEELHRYVTINPAFGFSTIEVHALLDGEQELTIMEEQRRALAEIGPTIS